MAKLRYQQTKIEQAPDTILVDAEIVAIIRAQQQWADAHPGRRWAAGTTPKHLFLAHKMSRRADKAYPLERINQTLFGFARRLDVRDGAKGNACLTCDKFATDATFLPELTAQRQRTEQLIAERQNAFTARTGHPMSEDNVWLAGRRQEQDALGRIILKLEQTRLADEPLQAVRRAGVEARTDAITRDRDGR
ncbi:hypothetical protein AB0N06_37300 [Streptomyces sp. NPDC051020]|uniref:hypothetical protein n=1 Tax=Streptomyces sp. NPDC051020 TaxID=3155409 RepID=UPI00342DE5A4